MAVKAKESPQVAKARRKLKKKIISESKQFNPDSLQKMSRMIEYWIARHKGERINLKDKSIKLFDENRHSAMTKNKFTKNLINTLKQGSHPTKPSKSLGGRISV